MKIDKITKKQLKLDKLKTNARKKKEFGSGLIFF